MRKSYVCIVMILLLLLAGCARGSAEPTATAVATTAATVPQETEPTAAQTLPAQTLPAETQPPAETEATATEEPATVETSGEVPYLQEIRGGVTVFDGPGYDYGSVSIIHNRGIFTIVEEAVDYEGNLWGRLKSGVGWIDLTALRSEEYENALITANYADDNLVLHGAYHHFSTKREYAIPIAFRAYGNLRDVTIFDVLYNAEGEYPGEDIFTLPELTEEMPLVAELDFPGDMSMYGIRFLDEDGNTHVYYFYMSARNGSLVFEAEQ